MESVLENAIKSKKQIVEGSKRVKNYLRENIETQLIDHEAGIVFIYTSFGLGVDDKNCFSRKMNAAFRSRQSVDKWLPTLYMQNQYVPDEDYI